MGWLDRMLGIEPAPPPVVAPAPDPVLFTEPPASAPAPEGRRGAAEHVARFDRAIAECRVMIERGEKSEARLAQLEHDRARWIALAKIEAGEY